MTRTTLQAVINQTVSADLNPLRDFLFSNPSEPLIATGSGGAETAGEFVALMKQGPLTLANVQESPVIEGAEDCHWCRAIMRDAAEQLPEEVLNSMGAKLYVADWDLDGSP